MQITFDSDKDQKNIEKHGVSLVLANDLEWETLQAKLDLRFDYGESRFIGLGFMGDRLYCVVFVDRGETRRIISLRKANLREVKQYAANH